MKRAALFLIVTLCACGAPAAEDDFDDLSAEVEDVEAKADGVSGPVGTFENGAQKGDVKRLVLKTDKTFYLEGQCPEGRYCIQVLPIRQGTYKLTRSGATRYVQLLVSGQPLVRYAYRSGATKLELRRVGDTIGWFSLAPAASAWCGEVSDCKVQNLSFPRCPGKITCERNTCGYQCGAVQN